MNAHRTDPAVGAVAGDVAGPSLLRRLSPSAALARLPFTVSLPAWADRTRRLPERRRAARAVRVLLPQLAGDLPAGAVSPSGSWRGSVRILGSASDLTVAMLSWPADQPVAVVKLPGSARAEADLRQHDAAIRTLAGDDRVGAWARLLRGCRLAESGGALYAVEPAAPGHDAGRRLTGGRLTGGEAEVLGLARLGLAAIGELHRSTSAPVRAGDADAWLRAPLDALRAALPKDGGEHAAVDRIEARLRAAAGAVEVAGWVHGDFTPGNVMVEGDAVTAILDWGQARRHAPTPLDVTLWLFSIYCATKRRPYGSLTLSALEWRRWPDDDPLLRLGADAVATSGLGASDLALWCWLDHVAGNLRKSLRYHRHPVWWAANVAPVLRAVTR